MHELTTRSGGGEQPEFQGEARIPEARRFAVAPMIDWTDIKRQSPWMQGLPDPV